MKKWTVRALDTLLVLGVVAIIAAALSPWGVDFRERQRLKSLEHARLDLIKDVEEAKARGVDVTKAFEEMGLLNLNSPPPQPQEKER